MMLNTDELGQVKPMTDFPPDSDEEAGEDGIEGEADAVEELNDEYEEKKEEFKDDPAETQ